MNGAGELHVHVLIDRLGWGGAEMLLSDLALAAPGAGLRMTVGYLSDVDGSPAAQRLRARGVAPALVPLDSLLRPAAHARVRAHLAAVAPDVVHTHLAYADMVGLVAARRLGLPAVSTVHLMTWEAGARRERAKLALAAAARRRGAGRVLTVSAAARAAYLQRGWDRPKRVLTVHNGVAGVPSTGAGAAIRSELGLGLGDIVVAMVSVLREGKGHEAAFDAVQQLRGRYPVRLLVAGDGPGGAELRAAAAALGDAVVMAGHRDDVMALLDAADVLLHPSHFDALPTTLLESLAAGTPIVASAVGGIPEIVDDGETGVLIAPPPSGEAIAHALEPLLADRLLRARMGVAARAAFEARFSAARWAQRLRAAYEGVM